MTLTPEQLAAGWKPHDGGPCPVAAALDCGDVERLRREGILSRFIITKPDPLEAVVQSLADECGITGASSLHSVRADVFRSKLYAALVNHGLAIPGEIG